MNISLREQAFRSYSIPFPCSNFHYIPIPFRNVTHPRTRSYRTLESNFRSLCHDENSRISQFVVQTTSPIASDVHKLHARQLQTHSMTVWSG